MRTLEGSNRRRNGVMGIIILVLVLGVGQSFASVPMLFASPTYYAQFRDTGGINAGDKVRIAGVDVGQVRSTAIDGDTVRIGFSLGGVQIGDASRAAIRTDTLLGRKNMEIEPRGQDALQANGILPVGQTTTPYQIYDAFFDATKAASGWDTRTVRESLSVLSETIDQTYPHLSAALDGVARFSDTIGKRDEQITELLGNANQIAEVLGNRGGQINALLVNAQTLFAAVNERSQAIDLLLQRVSQVSVQVRGFIDDNPNLNHVLEQLREVSDVLVERKDDLADIIVSASRFIGSLTEGLASGPFFKVMLVNLAPYQIIQPFVDAAFKERGIDPENFWRGAGLPEFQWPDPNAERHGNGAPPAAPTPIEGTPEHPGPAVAPGHPCSYTPAPGAAPRPGDPLPCADAGVGPFGDNPYGPNYAPPNVVGAPHNPDANPSPGIPSAAVPGQVSPNVPGAPGPPLVPGPPGARTVPVGPPAGPPDDFTPAIAPPVPPDAGPPPPGPGQQLPPVDRAPLPGNPPFLPPGAQEGTFY